MPLQIHPLVILFYNIFVPAIMLAVGPSILDIFFAIYSLSLLLLSGKFLRCIKFTIATVIFYVFYLLSFQSKYQGIQFLAITFSIMIRSMPCMMLASILIFDYSSDKLLTALQMLYLPKPFIIALTITLKYLPTFQREFKIIKDSMRLRGIHFRLTRPAQSFSYFIVPQLYRCLILTEEITSAGYTKGIDYKNRRSSYIDMRFKRLEVLLICILVLGTIGGILWIK